MKTSRWLSMIPVVLALAGGTSAEPVPQQVSYRGHKLVDVTVAGPKQLMELEQLGVSLACIPSVGQQKYVLPPDAVAVLDDLKIPYKVVNEDVQRLIDDEKAANDAAKAERGGTFHTAYRTLTEIDAYLNVLVASNPTIASRQTIGTSLQGRPIWAVRIAGPGAATNKSFAIICNIHAREWISPAIGMWVIDRLISDYGSDSVVTDLVNSANWYIVPTMNPDGYQHTLTDRLWRKNRRPNPNGSIGIDLNRNFSVGWSAPEGGNSTSQSDDTYRGPSEFSEPETQVIRDWVNSIPNLAAFMDIHSYSQLVLAPQGYTVALPARQPEFAIMTPEITDAITNTFGVPYIGGPTATTIYVAAGTSSDWAYGAKNIYGYGIECRDTGVNGFVLPPAQIIPNATEVFNGLAVLANYMNVSYKLRFIERPSIVDSDQSTTLNVNAVAFNLSSPAAGGANLYYRVGSSGPFTAVPLTGTFPDLTATVPPTPCGQTLEYYAEVVSSTSIVTRDPAGAPGSVYTAESFDVSTLVAEAFETANPGWATNIDATDTATTGRWARSDPQPTGAQPGDDHTPGTGTQCWVTDGNAGTSDGSFDIDGGKTSLYSAVLDLSGSPEAKISYWRWFEKTGGTTNTTDTLVVSISNGGAYVQVENVPYAESLGGWYFKEFRVADFVPVTSTVRVRFVAQDAGTGHVVEAALDDFTVQSITPCTPAGCVGDLNGDNAVNTADLTILLGGFGTSVTPGSGGDVNGDGVVNTADLTQLLGRFGTTCP